MTTVTPSLCSKYCSLTIDHTKVSEAGSYAVLFDGSGDSSSFGTRLPDDLCANCQSDGGDICFTSDSAGTSQISCEIVAISTSAKTAEIWVPVTLSVSSDITIYVWYKSKAGTLTQPSASGSLGSQAVWTAVGSYLSAWHGGTSASLGLSDSTGNNNLTNSGVTAGTGKIGGAFNFGGSAKVYAAQSNLTGMAAVTVSHWVNITSVNTGFRPFVTLPATAGWSPPYAVLQTRLNSGATTQVNCWVNDYSSYNFTTSTSLGTANWNYVTFTYDGSLQSIFINTTSGATKAATGSITGSTQPVQFGNDPSNSGPLNGLLDEVRIRSVADSKNRIDTDYNIQSSTSLVTVGTPVGTTKFRTKLQTGGNLSLAGIASGGQL